jgi:hypothetical protein
VFYSLVEDICIPIIVSHEYKVWCCYTSGPETVVILEYSLAYIVSVVEK